MHNVSTHAIPELAEGLRICWEEEEQAYVLLYPEGMVVLNHSVGDLLQRCDGYLTVEEIIAQMKFDLRVRFDEQHIQRNIDQVVSCGWLRLK